MNCFRERCVDQLPKVDIFSHLLFVLVDCAYYLGVVLGFISLSTVVWVAHVRIDSNNTDTKAILSCGHFEAMSSCPDPPATECRVYSLLSMTGHQDIVASSLTALISFKNKRAPKQQEENGDHFYSRRVMAKTNATPSAIILNREIFFWCEVLCGGAKHK